MTRKLIATLLTLGACVSSASSFRTSDSLELPGARPGIIDAIARDCAVDGWRLEALNKEAGVVAFERRYGRAAQETIQGTLPTGSTRLRIDYFALGSRANNEHATRVIAAFKQRVRNALGS